MPLYGIHWQMTDAMRRDLPEAAVALVTEQLMSSAQGVGAIIKEDAEPHIQWHQMNAEEAMMLNTSLAGRGFDTELCLFEAGDWFVRAVIETVNGPG